MKLSIKVHCYIDATLLVGTDVQNNKTTLTHLYLSCISYDNFFLIEFTKKKKGCYTT